LFFPGGEAAIEMTLSTSACAGVELDTTPFCFCRCPYRYIVMKGRPISLLTGFLPLLTTPVTSFAPLKDAQTNKVRNRIFEKQQPSLARAFDKETVGPMSSSLYLGKETDTSNDFSSLDRRSFLDSSWLAAMLLTTTSSSSPAQARGLVQFPCREPLGNTYHFMRAGQSLLEEEDIWSTNPLFLTNREAALSELGVEQVVAAAQVMKEQDFVPTVAEYSLAANAIDTAGIIGRECRMGRDRVLAEYTFLDPRAVGKWDMLPMASTQKAVWAMDVDEAGQYGKAGRMPPNEDGTPNETLADQAVRLRQLFSVVETQYSGDTVLLIFPDGTGPALLSCLISGIPLNRCHELEYEPGEVRLDVTAASTMALLKEKQSNNAAYKDAIAEGRIELTRLREMKPNEVVSVKDQLLEKDRLEQENLANQRALARQQKEEQDRKAREERIRQMEAERQLRREAGESDFDGLLPAGLAVGAVGGGALLAMPKSEDEPALAFEGVGRGANDTAIQLTPAGGNMTSALLASNSTMLDAADSMTAMMEEPQRVNGDRQATFVKPKPKDPKQAAEQAMKDYMDSDDGGEAWLQLMVDMAAEDDEKGL
jgi:broad specificity phosphatase PhoE